MWYIHMWYILMYRILDYTSACIAYFIYTTVSHTRYIQNTWSIQTYLNHPYVSHTWWCILLYRIIDIYTCNTYLICTSVLDILICIAYLIDTNVLHTWLYIHMYRILHIYICNAYFIIFIKILDIYICIAYLIDTYVSHIWLHALLVACVSRYTWVRWYTLQIMLCHNGTANCRWGGTESWDSF